jgi:hypothetical protein
VDPLCGARASTVRSIRYGEEDMFKREAEIRRLPELRGYAVAHTGAYLKT